MCSSLSLITGENVSGAASVIHRNLSAAAAAAVAVETFDLVGNNGALTLFLSPKAHRLTCLDHFAYRDAPIITALQDDLEIKRQNMR